MGNLQQCVCHHAARIMIECVSSTGYGSRIRQNTKQYKIDSPCYSLICTAPAIISDVVYSTVLVQRSLFGSIQNLPMGHCHPSLHVIIFKMISKDNFSRLLQNVQKELLLECSQVLAAVPSHCTSLKSWVHVPPLRL